MTATDVYSFETIFADALQTVLTDASLTAVTLTDDPELQKARPRVEIVFQPGQGAGQWTSVSGQALESAWSGQFVLFVITEAEVNTHLGYLAQVRASVHAAAAALNTALTRHRVDPFLRDLGTTSDWTPEEGAYISRLIIAIDFTIQADAWD